jgi:amidohydrolase
MMDINSLQEILIEHFKWFHKNPELSFAEHKTTQRIKTILQEHGIEIIPTPLETGLVARIDGTLNAVQKTVALRADIDALPIQEETGLHYRSENAGCMHACGHDFHITALLGAAILLHEKRAEFSGTVKLLFQPAEELSRGAENVMQTGALDDVDEIYGLHVLPELDAGTVAVSPGAAYAGVGLFKITVTGKGGHAAIPQLTIDPVIICARIITDVQTIVSRNIDPFAWDIYPALRQSAVMYAPDACPLCGEGKIPVVKPGSRKKF